MVDWAIICSLNYGLITGLGDAKLVDLCEMWAKKLWVKYYSRICGRN